MSDQSNTQPMHSPLGKGAYSITEFCEWASISRAKVYREISAGRIKPRKVGSKTLILRQDAEDYLNNLPLAFTDKAVSQ